jgi:hypothetical protein
MLRRPHALLRLSFSDFPAHMMRHRIILNPANGGAAPITVLKRQFKEIGWSEGPLNHFNFTRRCESVNLEYPLG